MTRLILDQWWKSKHHRLVRGARGARFASIKFHALFFASLAALFAFLLRENAGDRIHRLPAPPVAAPPPLARSVSYSLASEMPHLLSLELEDKIPEHVPQQYNVNYRKMRGEL